MASKRMLQVHCSTLEVIPSSPPARPILSTGAQLWYATLGSLTDQLADYELLLDREELARADRFLHQQDRVRFVLGHGLLRSLLGQYLGTMPQRLDLLRGEFGKPYLDGDPLHFNLSDTKDAVLVAIASDPIGADIETMNRSTDHERVADHYFTRTEVESIRNAPDGKRRFLELWTRKEAVLKACGVGLMDDLHSLEVGDAHNRMTISHADFIRLAAPSYHVVTLAAGADQLISVASETPITALELFHA
jgi:4'-phosphopantetheinyl transferase